MDDNWTNGNPRRTQVAAPSDPPGRAESGSSAGSTALAEELVARELCELDELGQLAADWDSQGSPPPTKAARSLARDVLVCVAASLGNVARDRVRPYAVAPMPGGAVFLEWRGKDADVEVHVGPEGDLGYLVEDRRGLERTFEEGDAAPLTTIVKHITSVIAEA